MEGLKLIPLTVFKLLKVEKTLTFCNADGDGDGDGDGDADAKVTV